MSQMPMLLRTSSTLLWFDIYNDPKQRLTEMQNDRSSYFGSTVCDCVRLCLP